MKIKLSLQIFILFAAAVYISPAQEAPSTGPSEQELLQITRQIQVEGLDWKADLTSVGRLTRMEKLNRLGALIPFAEDPSLYAEIQTLEELPAVWNWTDRNGGNYVTTVKDQGDCGSCWAFAVIGVMEAVYNVENSLYSSELQSVQLPADAAFARENLRPGTGRKDFRIREPKYPDFSEQFLISCSQAGDCSGGYEDEALDYLKQKGVVPEDCFPYAAENAPCSPCSQWELKLTRMKNWGYVTQSHVRMNAIKSALMDGPLVMFMEVYSDFYYYRSGIYKPVSSASYEGGHCVVLVGYNEQHDYWICKNSWGRGWGEEGYFRIRFGACETGTWVSRGWNVSSDNQPPEMVPLTDKTVKEGQELDFIVTASDPDNDTLTFFAAPLPQGAQFSREGRFVWKPSYTQSGRYTLRISVTDGLSERTQKVDIQVINVKKGKGKF